MLAMLCCWSYESWSLEQTVCISEALDLWGLKEQHWKKDPANLCADSFFCRGKRHDFCRWDRVSWERRGMEGERKLERKWMLFVLLRNVSIKDSGRKVEDSGFSVDGRVVSLRFTSEFIRAPQDQSFALHVFSVVFYKKSSFCGSALVSHKPIRILFCPFGLFLWCMIVSTSP